MQNLYILLFIIFAVSTSFGFILIPRIVDFCTKHNLYDIPSSRKLHNNAIPRLGGVCFLPCALLSFTSGLFLLNYITGKENLLVNQWSVIFFVSLLIIYIVGIVDDIVGLGATAKFTAQIVAATFLPLSGLYINNLYGLFGIHAIPLYIGAPLTVLVMVFVTNAINLIDGIDGLAAGLSLLSLTGYMVCFMRDGVFLYAIFISGLMGIIFSYLYFNLWGDVKKKHKIFMGDSGSLTLGFVLGFLLIKYSMNNPHVMPYRSDSLLTAYTLLIVPCFDVVRVSCLRLLRGKPLFRADKSHIHHRLMLCGLTQHQTLVTILAFSLSFLGLNVLLHGIVSSTVIVFIDILVFTVFMSVVEFLIWRKSHLNAE